MSGLGILRTTISETHSDAATPGAPRNTYKRGHRQSVRVDPIRLVLSHAAKRLASIPDVDRSGG